MKITIDPDVCIGAGQCVLSAGAVFDQDEDTGLVVLLDASPPEELANRVREAAAVCPARAISLDENG
jgi:ferredoxin